MCTNLNNIDNYLSETKENTTTIITKYFGIISMLLTIISDNIYITNNKNYKYILKIGIQTLSHIFLLLLLFTNNLEIATYHTQKALYYYVEFISQIDNDNTSFLKLTHKDAIFFVYKKTIYDINKDFKNENENKNENKNENENDKRKNYNLVIRLYNNLLFDIIDEQKISEPIELLKNIDNQTNKIIQNLLNLHLKRDDNKYYNKLDIIDFFINNFSFTKKYIYIELFIKKLNKTDIYVDDLQKKLKNSNFNNNIMIMTPIKFINWLYC